MNPFDALGLPARSDLTDEQVRAAWRAIAAATHPDRADGGDLARYTQASAAYAELRTPWGRSEACADLAEQAWPGGRGGTPGPGSPGGTPGPGGPGGARDEPVTAPLPAVPAAEPRAGARPRHPLAAARELPSRIRRGRPRRLLVRAAVAAALSLAVLRLIPGTAAAPADITGLVTWLMLTARRDLAPPPER